MAGVMNFHALRQQPFAAPLTAPRKAGPPGLGAHPRAKTVLILSGALRALKCSFHDRCLLKSRYLTGEVAPVNCPFLILLIMIIILLPVGCDRCSQDHE